jgi:hypothetical protein
MINLPAPAGGSDEAWEMQSFIRIARSFGLDNTRLWRIAAAVRREMKARETGAPTIFIDPPLAVRDDDR